MNRKTIIYVVVGVVLVIGGFYGYNYYRYLQTHTETDDAQIEGNIVPVLARTGSYIASIHVVDNQAVKKGQLLVELDSLDLQSKAAQSIAAWQSSKTSVNVARSQAADVQAQQQLMMISIEGPKTNLWKAQNEYNRYNDLFQQKLATPQQLDNVKADLENAQAAFDLAKQKHESSKVNYQTALNQLKVAEANADQKKKDVDYARLQLSYTKVLAPIDGVVSKKTIQTGQLIQAGQPLMTLVQNKEVWVVANFKETQLEGMEINSPVTVKVDAYPSEEFKGKIESFSGATGAKFSLIPPDNASGNFVKVVQRVSIRIALDTTQNTLGLLKPGLSVQAVVSVGKK
jgi:membrane fusion protein (multidrug efflux system)